MALAGIALAISLCAPPEHPVIAEVFYDAIGDDSGREFVELLNRGDAPYPLAGARVEAGDGSGPGRWTLRWTGGSTDTLAAGGRFVIGGALVTPPVDAVASLDLQNGPDAVRVVWPDGAVEAVGWGHHEFAEYFCVEPAPDVASGDGLARVPDDADRGSNALDFQPASPSPGRANQPGRDLAKIAGSLALDPEQPDAGAPAVLTGRIANRGAARVTADAIGLRVRATGDAGDVTLRDGPIDLAGGVFALAPGDTAGWRADLAAIPAGKHALVTEVVLDGDEAAWNDTDTLRVRAGPGPLVLTEIQFHPAWGEGEWVEVANRSGRALDPATFTLSDRGAGRGRPSGGEGPLPDGALAVLAQDRDALLARFPSLDPRAVWTVRPWGSLNNTDGEDGFADEVVVREADGTTSSRHAYVARGIPAGVPIERRDGGDWWPSLEPDGTPLAPYRAPPGIAGRVRLSPRRLAAGSAPARLAWSLPWRTAVVDVDLYDLAGTRVARLVARGAVPDRGERDVDLSDVPPGLYVLVLRARDPGGAGVLQATEALRVDGAVR